MKKLLMLSILAGGLFASCKDKTEPAPTPVEDPAPAHAPAPQASSTTTTTTTTTTQEDPDGTSVSIGKDGFSLESKNGDNTSDVKVTKKEVKVEKTN